MYKHIQTRKYDIIVMIKKILLGILLMYPAFTISAQTLKDAFVNMPDSLLPSLSHNNRLDMIDFINSGMKAEVTNLFDGKSSMSMLNDRYLKIQLNDYVSVEMMLFTDSTASVQDSSSTYICMVTSYGAVPIESKVCFYDYRWNSRNKKHDFVGRYKSDLICRPDTMSTDNFEDLKPLLTYMTVVADLSSEDKSITFRAEFPLLSVAEREKAAQVVRKKKIYLADCIL